MVELSSGSGERRKFCEICCSPGITQYTAIRSPAFVALWIRIVEVASALNERKWKKDKITVSSISLPRIGSDSGHTRV